MIEQLNAIKDIKAGIKSALISAGVDNPGDVFADYPDLIRTLRTISGTGNEIVNYFFELVPDEFIVDNDVKYEKYRYKFADDVFVPGNELSREEISNAILIYESTVPDCISFVYTDSSGNTHTANSVNNTIYYSDDMLNMTIQSAVCPANVVSKVVLFDYDVLTGNVLFDKIFCNNNCDVEMFKAESYSQLINTWETTKVKSVHTKISDKCTALVEYIYGYPTWARVVDDYIESCSFEGDDSVQDITNIANTCPMLSGNLVLSGKNIITAKYAFDGCNFNSIVFRYPTEKLNNGYQMFCREGNLTEIYNLDFSSLSDSYLMFYEVTNLVNCKITNLGMNTGTINWLNSDIPPCFSWCEEDILYTFRNIAKRQSGELNVNSHIYNILDNNGLIPELNEKGWTVTV